ncbi:MAG: toll/interleukin-1 receptor domain-containing protein [Sphingomicrobium sp.]
MSVQVRRTGGRMTEHARIRRARTPRRSPLRVKFRKDRSPVRYFAFLSYSHKDEKLADWLHRELEQFRVPATLVGRITEHGAIPRRLTPIFRDAQELAAANDLGEEIEEALSHSQFLIVLCSPHAARSHWTNAEIDTFKRSRPDGCILAVIADGEPFASDIDGSEAEECFPPALRHRYDRLGRPTTKRAEPLAADLRGEGEARRTGFLKLVAGMLGVGLDDLVQRETTRRQRRLAFVASASLAGMVLASLLAVTAIQARDEARDERREAEGLVAFMLGDLKDKLEPIGRLDALDGVGAKVLDYYRKQEASGLPDNALLQRARALSLTAQVAYLRGDFGTAQNLYGEAMKGTGEAIERDPDDPQRLYDHAQNVFYFGQISADRGELPQAERAFRQYRELADRMTGRQPDNLKWKMEVQYAATNLGFVLLRQRRYDGAIQQLTKALRTIEAVAAVDGDNRDYQKSLAESLAWLADAQLASGDVAAAVSSRQRQVALLKTLAATSTDVAIQQKLIPAQQTLGTMLAALGRDQDADAYLKAAVATAERLVPAEPENSQWVGFAARAHLSLAQQSLAAGRASDAAVHAARGCDYASSLRRPGGATAWATLQQACLSNRAQLSLAQGRAAEAVALANRGYALAKSIKSNDPVSDRYAVAKSLLLTGDSYRAAGDGERARLAWQRGLTLAQSPREQPGESAIRAELLNRVGQRQQAMRVRSALAARGIRNATLI